MIIIKKDFFGSINLSNVKTTFKQNAIFKYINVMFSKVLDIIRQKIIKWNFKTQSDVNLIDDLETKAFLVSIDNLKTNKQIESETHIKNENENDNENNDYGFTGIYLLVFNYGRFNGKLAMDVQKI